jgi:hypothetical protein
MQLQLVVDNASVKLALSLDNVTWCKQKSLILMFLELQIENVLDGCCNGKQREVWNDSRVFERNGPYMKSIRKTMKIMDITDRVSWKQIKIKHVFLAETWFRKKRRVCERILSNLPPFWALFRWNWFEWFIEKWVLSTLTNLLEHPFVYHITNAEYQPFRNSSYIPMRLLLLFCRCIFTDLFSKKKWARAGLDDSRQ